MSDFYLLPERAEVARHFARFLAGWFPEAGNVDADHAEQLAAMALSQTDGFVVFADDVTEGEDLPEMLRDSFGAEAGDRVFDMRRGPRTRLDAEHPVIHIFPPPRAAAC